METWLAGHCFAGQGGPPSPALVQTACITFVLYEAQECCNWVNDAAFPHRDMAKKEADSTVIGLINSEAGIRQSGTAET